MSKTTSDFRQKYYLITGDPIGKGSYAVVYKCINRETQQEFAVKVVDKGVATPKDINSIDFEIRVMKHIGHHPHIVGLIDYYESEKHIYLVLDLLNGGMLFTHIVELSHYSEKNASELISKLLSALDHIHSKGIIHRDLKPENLLLRSKKGSSATDTSYLSDVCLADFGLAGKVPSRVCCGSPSYIAPEVINVGYYLSHKEPYDTKSDIWSLGVITYILLSGRMPFGGNSHQEIFKSIVSNKWSFSSEIWNTISPSAKTFINACLTPEPKNRPSAKELLFHPWIDNVQSDIHLEDSLQELRKFNAQQTLRAVVRVFCTTHSLLGQLDYTPPFMKYLNHKDKLSTVIEAQSQTDASKVHIVDFGKTLNPPPGWRLQDCCTCTSEMVCRHIQNVHEYLFVGKRNMDVYPFMDELLLMKNEDESSLKDKPKNKETRYHLEKVLYVIKAAYAFSAALAKVPQDQRKLNLMLNGSSNLFREKKESETSGKSSPRVMEKKNSSVGKLLSTFKGECKQN